MYWEDNDQLFLVSYDDGWWPPLNKYEEGFGDIMGCPSMYRYGCIYNSGNPSLATGTDYRGWVWHGEDIGYGYNMKAIADRGHTTTDTFLYPTRTGIMAETAQFYWWNALASAGNDYLSPPLSYWYADRHRKDFAQVLFLDGHVDWVQTPYPNGTKAFDGEDIQDPR